MGWGAGSPVDKVGVVFEILEWDDLEVEEEDFTA